MSPDNQKAFDELFALLKAAPPEEMILVAKQIYDLGFEHGWDCYSDEHDH